MNAKLFLELLALATLLAFALPGTNLIYQILGIKIKSAVERQKNSAAVIKSAEMVV